MAPEGVLAREARGGDRFVSTGELPRDTRIGEVVGEAYELFRNDRSGALSTVYPALSQVDPDRFGVCVAGVGGTVHEAGDSRSPFLVMSVAKPFVLALICQELGIDPVRRLVGVNATGLPFDSVAAIERDPAGRTNPMVNAGATAVDLYTRQSCLSVTAVDLAVMAATLADGGVNPLTGKRVLAPDVARVTLAVMAVAGLYETSGDWLVDVGVPGKSGIGGGIATVSPGKGGLGTWSPRLDAAGNSVRGQRVAGFLARRLGLDLLASAPVPAVQPAPARTPDA